jgi:4'-phosphopantetheinyl transferase
MELLSNEIHLYFVYPEKISDPALLDRYKSLLSDEELTQMPRFFSASHQHQYLLTRALLRTTLSAYYPVDPAAWVFGTNSYGKPQIRHPERILPIRFNLSHTRGMIMCGVVRDNDIGVDIEDGQRSTRAGLDRLSSYFSEKEIADLKQLPKTQQKQRFFDYWTLKESYIKARGMGLAIPLDKFSFHIKRDRLHNFTVHPDLQDDETRWQFWRMPMADRYRAAVAVNSNQDSFKIKAFNAIPFQSNDPISLTFL